MPGFFSPEVVCGDEVIDLCGYVSGEGFGIEGCDIADPRLPGHEALPGGVYIEAQGTYDPDAGYDYPVIQVLLTFFSSYTPEVALPLRSALARRSMPCW